MNSFKKILVPVDLSAANRDSIELATSIAKCNDAELLLAYIALPPLPRSAASIEREFEASIEAERVEFESLSPGDQSVGFKRIFERGNPGPDIVRLANEHECDLVIIGTHGRTGIARVLMGSVAEYVVRNAGCPVLTVKTLPKKKDTEPQESTDSERVHSPFVTSAMQHVQPVRKEECMEQVCQELSAARSTAAPVVDHMGKCIGILTTTDITHFRNLQSRFEQKDPSVVKEIYETNEYGQVRTCSESFEKVLRHMTEPVITIAVDQSCADAREIFDANPNIHHLVVVDDANRPLGIVDLSRLDELDHWEAAEAATRRNPDASSTAGQNS